MKVRLALLAALLFAAACRPPASPPQQTVRAPVVDTTFIDLGGTTADSYSVMGACWIPSRSQLVVAVRASAELAIFTIGDELKLHQVDGGDFFFNPVPSPNGEFLAADEYGGTGQSTVHLFQTKDWSTLHKLPGSDDATALRWSPDSRFLYGSGVLRAAKWDALTGKVVTKTEPPLVLEHWGAVNFGSLDNPAIVTINDTVNPPTLFDLDSGKSLSNSPSSLDFSEPHRYSPDKKRHIERTSDKLSYVVTDIASGKELARFKSDAPVSQEFGFVTDDLVFSGTHRLELLSLKTEKSVAAFVFFFETAPNAYEHRISGWAAILPDGRFTGSQNADEMVKVGGAKRDDRAVVQALRSAFEP